MGGGALLIILDPMETNLDLYWLTMIIIRQLPDKLSRSEYDMVFAAGAGV